MSAQPLTDAEEAEKALRRNTLRDRIQEALLDLDSRQLMAEAGGYSNMDWRRWSSLDLAEDIARQIAPTLAALARPAEEERR